MPFFLSGLTYIPWHKPFAIRDCDRKLWFFSGCFKEHKELHSSADLGDSCDLSGSHGMLPAPYVLGPKSGVLVEGMCRWCSQCSRAFKQLAHVPGFPKIPISFDLPDTPWCGLCMAPWRSLRWGYVPPDPAPRYVGRIHIHGAGFTEFGIPVCKECSKIWPTKRNFR